MIADLGKVLNQRITQTVLAGSPSGIYDGVYIGDGKVQLEQTLEVSVLIPEHLTDYTVEAEYEVETSEVEHEKPVEIKKLSGKLTIKNHLEEGDHVLVLRYQQEKKYVAIARLV